MSLEASKQLAAEYSSKAAFYARQWAPVLHPMARHVLEALPLADARRILDLGCGTGDLLEELHSRAPYAHVIGADRAEGMLRFASTSHSCSLLVTDAACLALQDQCIDITVVAFALFHVPDPAAALREIRRVLRRGGHVAIVTWGQDPGLPGTSIWAEELDACGAAADPRDPRVMNQPKMNTPARLMELLQEAAFAAPRVWSEPLTYPWSAEALVALQSSCGTPSRRLATLSRNDQTVCVERARTRIAALASNDLVYRAEVLYGIAQRPED